MSPYSFSSPPTLNFGSRVERVTPEISEPAERDSHTTCVGSFGQSAVRTQDCILSLAKNLEIAPETLWDIFITVLLALFYLVLSLGILAYYVLYNLHAFNNIKI